MFAVILSAFLVCLKGLTNYSLPRAKKNNVNTRLNLETADDDYS